MHEWDNCMTQTSHLGWLDEVRGGAALYVLIHHAVMQVRVDGQHAHDVAFRLMELASSFGHYAVDIFIVLSGFCLMLPVIKRGNLGNVPNFFLRRSLRILPPYYAVLILCLIIDNTVLSQQDNGIWANLWYPITSNDILRHIFLIDQWYYDSTNKINDALWSIGVEYEIYFLMPLLLYMSHKVGDFLSVVLIFFGTYSVWIIFHHFDVMNPSHTGSSVYYILLFYMGMLAAKYSQNNQSRVMANLFIHPKIIEKISILGILGMAAISFVLSKFANAYWIPYQIQSAIIGFFASLYLCAHALHSNQTNNGHFRYRLLGVIGTMGFSFYLLHEPVIALCWKFIILPMHIHSYWLQATAIIVLSIPFTMLISFIFYKFIELPSHEISKAVRST